MNKKNKPQQNDDFDEILESNDDIRQEFLQEQNSQREEEFKKIFPYVPYITYQLSEEEKMAIKELDEFNLTAEMIESLKTLTKNVFNTDIDVSLGCGACKPQILAKMVKLKMYLNFHDKFQ